MLSSMRGKEMKSDNLYPLANWHLLVRIKYAYQQRLYAKLQALVTCEMEHASCSEPLPYYKHIAR